MPHISPYGMESGTREWLQQLFRPMMTFNFIDFMFAHVLARLDLVFKLDHGQLLEHTLRLGMINVFQTLVEPGADPYMWL